MIQVKDFYYQVVRSHGQETASDFLRLIKEWDGSPDTFNSFYEEDVLQWKLEEAK